MRLAALAFAALALVACSKKSKEKDVEPPAELVSFPATIKVDRVWQAGVSGKSGPLRLQLGLAVDGSRVYAAGSSGEVASFDLKNGKQLWQAHLKGLLSGGTAAGNGIVVVGTNKGDVYALEQTSGAVRWHVRVGGEILAAAAIGSNVAVVRTVDGKLHGLALASGKESWLQEQQIPRLTLRGTASPVIVGDSVICGFDNGKVVAVGQSDGAMQWEATVSPPKGRTELERLVDIDSAVRVIDQDVYVVGFQGRAAMLALDSGQVWWARDFSSYHGLDVDDETVYISTASGELVAMRRKTGAELWRQNALARRGLTAPAAIGGAVVVGDSLGYVHWLDKATGALAARESLGGRIAAPPVVAGDLLLVVNDAGRIAAYRARQSAAAAAPPGG
jgi:outer membrane protein assembly factor BamB